MKKQIITLVVLLVVYANEGVKAQNLVQNPGAESFNASTMAPNNWTIISGSWISVMAPGYVDSVHSGQYMFVEGSDQVGVLQQDVDVSIYAASIDSFKKKFLLSVWEQSYEQFPTDAGIIIVQCLNATKSQTLSTWTSDSLVSTVVWAQTVHNFRAPVGTRYVRIQLIAYRNNGSDNDGYFDDISLTPSTSNLAVNEVAENGLFSISPNPANDNISVSLKSPGIYHLSVVSMTGKMVMNRELTQSGNVDISFLPAGHYVLHLFSNDFKKSQKMQLVKL